jgi:hypothetical protein
MEYFSIMNLTFETETEAVRLGLYTYGFAIADGFDGTYSIFARFHGEELSFG